MINLCQWCDYSHKYENIMVYTIDGSNFTHHKYQNTVFSFDLVSWNTKYGSTVMQKYRIFKARKNIPE